jgi:integrase
VYFTLDETDTSCTKIVGRGLERSQPDKFPCSECFDIADKVRKIQQGKRVERELLFVAKTLSDIECKLYRICKQLDILKRSTHKIRKTYISTLLNNRVDADFVREQVGHRDLKTTFDSYTYSTTRKEKNLEKLQQVLG